jgi:putative DNA primase/helicase
MSTTPTEVTETKTPPIDADIEDVEGVTTVAEITDMALLASGAATRPADFMDGKLAARVANGALIGRYCWASGLGWLHWDGKRWARCPDVAVTECVRSWVVAQFDAAARLARTGKTDGALVKKWIQPLASGRLNALVKLTRGIPGVYADGQDFDTHADLLNVHNGVVDLRTGNLRPHDPALKLTKLVPVAYSPGAEHPDWTAALEAVPEDVRDWYQIRLGQSITGHMTPDDAMVVQVGGGENGKSTITSAVMKTLGDYAVLVSDKVILADSGAHTTEKMELRGARFALIEETPEARRLSVSLLKKVLGTPTMTARYIRENETRWEASHSLFLSTNYIPIVEEADWGTWRRLLLLIFPYTFRKAHEVWTSPADRLGDPGLRGRLAGPVGLAHEATLAWLISGATTWYASNRAMPAPPKRIIDDTRGWRSESDLVLGFLDDRMEFTLTGHVWATELLADVNAWLAARGHRAWSDKLLASRFGGHHEVTGHDIIKRRVKTCAEGAKTINGPLSRRPMPWGELPATPPDSYWAWVGLRFADTADAYNAASNGRGPYVPPAQQY